MDAKLDLLTHAEIESLICACSKRSPSGRRNRALIATMWRGGLRVSEALTLTPRDVNLVQGTITIVNGNEQRRRVVGIDIGTSLLVDQWLVSRKRLQLASSAPLFCTLKGGKIDPSYVRHLLPRVARRARVDRRVHAHALRHRFAVDLIQEGRDLFTVRDLLGHSSAATTHVCLSRIGVTVGSSKTLDFPTVGSDASCRSGSRSRQT